MNIKSVLTTFTSKYLVYVLIATTAVNGAGWYVTSLKLDTATAQVETEKANVKKAYAECKAASSEAKAKNVEEVKRIEDNYVKLAQEGDARLNDLRKQFNAYLVQYAQSKGSTGGVRLSESTITTDGSNITSDSTEISISFEDAGICAENTARLQTVKEWADKVQSDK